MAEIAERVGARMRQRRKELRLTQAEVAKLIEGKTTSDQVSRWERGKHQPNDLGPIAKALEVDVSYFYAADPADNGSTPDPFPAQPTALRDELAHIREEIQSLRRERTQEAQAVRELLEVQNQVLRDLTAAVEQEKQARAESEAATRDLLAAVDVANRALLAGSPRTEATPGPRAT